MEKTPPPGASGGAGVTVPSPVKLAAASDSPQKRTVRFAPLFDTASPPTKRRAAATSNASDAGTIDAALGRALSTIGDASIPSSPIVDDKADASTVPSTNNPSPDSKSPSVEKRTLRPIVPLADRRISGGSGWRSAPVVERDALQVPERHLSRCIGVV